jgi:hypothetical protein
MTKYLETKISSIPDKDFQTLIAELCECFDWAEDEFENKSLANLFTIVVTEQKEMNLQKVLIDRILAKKVKEMALGSVIYGVCCELVNRKGKSMDDFAGKSIFTVIKQCCKVVCPPLSRTKRLTRLQIKHQRQTELIKRRRSNGFYF